MKPDIHELAVRAAEFNDRLALLKTEREFSWYPYDSLGNFENLERLLTGGNRRLLDLIGNSTVLDIGCGDGDLALFLEAEGCDVRAIDHPSTNCNGMRGVRALKESLTSNIEIQEMDLDAQFHIDGRYGMAFFLGILYHLKNPFHALEQLALHCRYCILSTRIARIAPEGNVDISALPVAYLLGHREANADPTNFWVFSEAGLRRIIERANWHVFDFVTMGNTVSSDPVSAEGDERAYCLLRSRAAFRTFRPESPKDWGELLYGWHGVEDNAWRWTQKRFASTLTGGGALVRLEFFLHEAVLAATGPLTLRMNGGQERTFNAPGHYVFLARAEGALRFEFELSGALGPSDADRRELGLLVSEIGIE